MQEEISTTKQGGRVHRPRNKRRKKKKDRIEGGGPQVVGRNEGRRPIMKKRRGKGKGCRTFLGSPVSGGPLAEKREEPLGLYRVYPLGLLNKMHATGRVP